MKRIIIIVPDKINHSLRTFQTNHTKEKPVTKQLITRALELDDYDENLYFPKGAVTVASIEDI